MNINHLAKLPIDWARVWVLICTVHLTVCSCHVTYAFQSESKLYGCLNVKEVLAQSRPKIWSSNDCIWTRTQNYLARKWTFNHLAELAKSLSFVLSSSLCGAFDCMFWSSHVGVSERIHSLKLPECQGNLCLKQVQYLKSKWLKLHSNPESLSS